MPNKPPYPPEVRERAVRMVFEHQGEYPTQWAAIRSVAEKIGCTSETRRKVLDQGLSSRDLTPAMRHTPRRRLRDRALHGSSAVFPVDPSVAYAALAADVEEAGHIGKGGTFELVRELEEEIAAVVDDAAADPARLLAARRAALTAVQEVAHRADDCVLCGKGNNGGDAPTEPSGSSARRPGGPTSPHRGGTSSPRRCTGATSPNSSPSTTTPIRTASRPCRGAGHARPTCR